MRATLTRREIVAAALAAACSPGRSPEGRSADPFIAVEARLGGRVGVVAVDSRSGASLARRADERFAMCSTFKWALVAAVLARVDRRELALDHAVAFAPSDLLEYAPVTRAHVGEGRMTIAALAAAAIELSDNTAANLLLGLVGGPAGVTRFFRGLGDGVTRLDRTEPTLNTNLRGDARDTTSPRAMAASLRAVVAGSALSATGRQRLIAWLVACKTGKRRLRAGLPPGWLAGDKSGSGANGAANDVAVVWPPGRAPVVIAAYLDAPSASAERLDAAHAAIGRIVARRLGGA